jgi:hypothetical protein
MREEFRAQGREQWEELRIANYGLRIIFFNP